jgi:hypothetical protein
MPCHLSGPKLNFREFSLQLNENNEMKYELMEFTFYPVLLRNWIDIWGIQPPYIQFPNAI